MVMRNSVSCSSRQLSRYAQQLNQATCRSAARRWNSTQDGGHQWSTPLAKQLTEAIRTTGPIPVASYMRQCLTSDLGGYYTPTSHSPERDQFGIKGDFVTSPEISQIFGELIGLWFVAEWIAQGRKENGIYFMEVGPGRGTLMDDMLRTIRNFPSLVKAIDTVYLIEASENLRHSQHRLLCGEDNPMQKNDIGFESRSRHSKDLKIVWAENIRLVPKELDRTPFIVAHEFFDALPIHIFQVAKPTPGQENTIQTPTGPIRPQRRLPQKTQWREMLVTPCAPHRLKAGEPEFELSLSQAATPHSMYLPDTSPRYTALRDTDSATIEISPESQAYAREFAIRLGGSNPTISSPESSAQIAAQARPVRSPPQEQPYPKPSPSGAALIIDYGPAATIPANSLRGIRAHKRVSPLESPGAVDVSADVDFLALAESALNASPGVEAHGPVDQARFLTAMGIQERAAQLVKQALDRERGAGSKTEVDGTAAKDKSDLTELVKRIEAGWKRLVDRSPQGMGKLYQVMAFLPYVPTAKGEVKRRPVGFGGDVQF